jgi:pilus assembly protein TadC
MLVAADRATVAVPLAILAVAVALPARRQAVDDLRARAGLARDVPRAAELMATCRDAGTPPGEAVAAVCAETAGPVATALRPVAAALEAGIDPATAWALTGDRRGDPLGRLGRAYVRGAATGAPLARSLRAVASDERTRTRAAAEAAARRAGVRAIGPLAVCFLPAFLVLGVVPVVVGVASQVLRDLG